MADTLRREIIAGLMGPGERLTQEDIGARLGVSRVPVREALVILEQEGWISMEMQRGGRVLPIESSIADNAEVWDLIFSLMARRASDRLTPEQDAQLAAIAADLSATKDAASIWNLCDAYLDVVFEAASAPPVARTLRRIRTMAIDTIFDVVPATLEPSRRGTLAVIEAIRNRDAEGAVAAHEEMQAECLHLLEAVFSNRNTSEPTT
ncbi:GntR family transcriptional regulator [Mycobacterium sp.]|uniref:GntR family transcriptional regulator n=1 Tax=Mycobacterium sp. TaxID=1785 RepID=UPI002D9EB523|nr:GntR family transcriptional regulator [Mycobacterium sp.]